MSCYLKIYGDLYTYGTSTFEKKHSEIKHSEIKHMSSKLFYLTRLFKLILNNNLIKIVPDPIEKLSNLVTLDLAVNEITTISPSIGKLHLLEDLDLSYNYIHTIPKELVDLKVVNFRYFGTSNTFASQIKKPLPASIEKLLNTQIKKEHNIDISNSLKQTIKKPLITPIKKDCDKSIYNDTQNVHNIDITNSLKQTIRKLLLTPITINYLTILEDLTKNNCIELIQIIKKYMSLCGDDIHFGLQVTYKQLFTAVYQRIYLHPDKKELLKILQKEMTDGITKCYTSKIGRLVNTLSGFDKDVEIHISNNEQIGNILSILRKKYLDNSEFNLKARKELNERGYTKEIISEWLTDYEYDYD